MTTFKNYINPHDIRVTHPEIDCKFCELHNFVDWEGNVVDSQYALCTNQENSHGCTAIDIVYDATNLLWEVSCKNCKKFISKNQLLLF